jgi:hypothetical protein
MLLVAGTSILTVVVDLVCPAGNVHVFTTDDVVYVDPDLITTIISLPPDVIDTVSVIVSINESVGNVNPVPDKPMLVVTLHVAELDATNPACRGCVLAISLFLLADITVSTLA